MSFEPTRVVRSGVRSLAPLIMTAIREDVPVPDRKAALSILEVTIDQLLCIPGMRRKLQRYVESVVQFMRSKGFEIEDPPQTKKRNEVELALKGLENDALVRWVRQQFQRRPGEDYMTYLRRASLFAARILAIYGYIAPGWEFGEEE